MSKPLFDNFEPITAKQWKQKIQFDLDGADYNDTLIWTSNEGIPVKPFYNSEDTKTLQKFHSYEEHDFKICETIYVHNTVSSNKYALKVLNRGVDTLKFVLPSKDVAIDKLLSNINVLKTPIHLEFQFLSEDIAQNLYNTQQGALLYSHVDIIGNLAKSGNWYTDLNTDFEIFNSMVDHTRMFSVNVGLYQNAGANMVQELAYALAHANEYLNYFNTATGEKINPKSIVFNVAIGSNYFFEIAKLRALRWLWHILVLEYNLNINCHIFATPSKRNKAIYDYNTNMLRTTTECMSAILGGANTINNLPYDAIYHKTNTFGNRIARNQLLILKHESYFNMVNNAADGCYYIETLTQQLAEKALALFKDIEANGGFLNQLKMGTIQRKINESATKEQAQFDNGEIIILGSNKHVNPKDKMAQNLELYPFVKQKKRKTLIAPIIEKRLTETLEQKRLKTE